MGQDFLDSHYIITTSSMATDFRSGSAKLQDQICPSKHQIRIQNPVQNMDMMVTQNMLRMHRGRQVFSERKKSKFATALVLIKCLEQM